MIKLRQAQFSDCTAIARLHADSWQKTYRGILSEQYLNDEVEKERLATWQERFKSQDKNQVIIIATQNDEMAGFCCVFLNDDPVFGSLIDNLHVSSALHRSGIGKMLVKECAKQIFDKAENKKMYLWVYESNTNARLAYERLSGINSETVEKENPDGTYSRTCRITWDDVSTLI